MPPKFRGNSDDWLDTEDAQGAARAPSRKKKRGPDAERGQPLPPEQANATVSEVFPKLCRVRLDQPDPQTGATEPLCSYRRAALFSQDEAEGRERSPVAVGDRVLVTVGSPDSGVVEGLCERSNFLSRPAPGEAAEGKARKFHVLAANLDALVIVAAAKNPDFSPGVVDRFLIAAQASGIHPILVINKADLLETGTSPAPWELYRDLEFELFEVSAKRELGVDRLQERISGKRAAFCGHSGVGKTSLLRKLTGREIGKVGVTNEQTGKGRHTTSSAFLIEGPGGSRWIDTPGVREFGLRNVTPSNLAGFFPEFHGLACATPGCFHAGEPGCEATGLARYASYRRIHQSLVENGS